MTEFYQTVMGKMYYERTLPNLVKQLETLNENFAKMIVIFEQGVEFENERKVQKSNKFEL